MVCPKLALLHLLCSPSLEELYNASGSKENVGLSTGGFRYNGLFLRSLLASKLYGTMLCNFKINWIMDLGFLYHMH